MGFVPFLSVRLPQESFVAFPPTPHLTTGWKGKPGFYEGQEFWGRVALRLPGALLHPPAPCGAAAVPPRLCTHMLHTFWPPLPLW